MAWRTQFRTSLSILTILLIWGGAAFAIPVTFKDGVNSYSGTVDLFIGDSTTGHQSSNNATRTDLYSGGGTWHTLMRFDNLFGTGPNQVPLPSGTSKPYITSASLTLTPYQTGTQTHTIYQMTVPFTESSSWTSLGSGVQIGSETLATPVFTGSVATTAGTPVTFDVTSAIQSWFDGSQPNNGFYFVDPNSSGALWYSRETGLATRPLLTINFAFIELTPEPGTIALWTVAGFGGFVWWWRRRKRHSAAA